ncbi:hypothetical protein [Mucilaginibacter myungsuensis]|uniref:Uncharacterized protein n=1 Tax=Mucilaginibacter myungsuensis TaxID=649104 RepID=A0A929KYD6_9SPHI|nr:hypothetical protein [Mucilaginibacter myungsuensis]MBE9662927.1 hypothetical protein [Mucilaginibacter myungsuensis]MDN3598549.1 hypothetical protein [Mucilaginibacter myungsuensis]
MTVVAGYVLINADICINKSHKIMNIANHPHDPELTKELQELYFTGQHWLNELAHTEDEAMALLKAIPDVNLADLYNNACHDRALLRRNIAIFMNKVCLLLVDEEEAVEVGLIETFIGLQTKIGLILTELNDIKFTLTGRTQAA